MIWIIILCTWALVITVYHFAIGQVWQQRKYLMVLAGISLVASIGLYYYLGYPNLPDHPYGLMVELLRGKAV